MTEKRLFFQFDQPESPSPDLDGGNNSHHDSFSITSAASNSKSLSLFRSRDSKTSKNFSSPAERASVTGLATCIGPSITVFYFYAIVVVPLLDHYFCIIECVTTISDCMWWLQLHLFYRGGAGKGGLNLRYHQFYCDTDWSAVFRRESMPPFVPPHSTDLTDTRNFDKVS